ncbi:hypothetical protein GCM10010387_54040 [Streptomyces inusitatus]|uniref:Uncharacterized protein n=1 Tax=Streptomyces inusitatus TaxID=68221 RepID=A0A918QIN9_9ACTN|nr:hypothetical protein GCM10010387_54040 [Streptomyces inusitatus]
MGIREPEPEGFPVVVDAVFADTDTLQSGERGEERGRAAPVREGLFRLRCRVRPDGDRPDGHRPDGDRPRAYSGVCRRARVSRAGGS